MKKIISVAVAISMLSLIFTACGSKNSVDDTTSKDTVITAEKTALADSADKKVKIVTTIFPEYDWVNEILGDKKENADVYMLLDNGVDLHSYQPTADDIANIADCDLFIYVSGESDDWMDDALKEKVNDNMVVLNLLDILGNSVKEEEIVEGMEAEEEEEEEEGEEGPEYDEHVWLSLKNASVICDAIENALETIDPDNKSAYNANAETYKNKLAELDSEYANMVSSASTKIVLFGDRFPFRYLIDDYGLSYYAAFVGCSAETEASFETVAFLAKKIDELGLTSVLTIESSDHKIAATIIQNTEKKDAQILTMDSMQSTTSDDVTNGANYLNIMKDNLEVLKTALN